MKKHVVLCIYKVDSASEWMLIGCIINSKILHVFYFQMKNEMFIVIEKSFALSFLLIKEHVMYQSIKTFFLIAHT